MDKSRISSFMGTRNRERFQIDEYTMAGIHHDKKYTPVYISRRLSMSIKEIEAMFAAPVFHNPKVSINPSYIKNPKDSFYAKVIFDKSVTIDSIKDAICDFLDNSPSRKLTDNERKRIEVEIKSIEEDIEKHGLEGTDKLAVVKTRVNQGIFRDLLIRRYKKCCLCGTDEESLLIASHIKPWVDSTRKERVDVDNGLLLCPNHDKLFDKGYITFDEQGYIVISGALSETNQLCMNVDSDMKILMSETAKSYMQYHRENVFIDRLANL